MTNWVLPPLSRWKAEKALVDEFIYALKTRPDDFSYDKFHLTDNKTGHIYWIANEAVGFSPSPKPAGLEGGIKMWWWNRHRAWNAFIKWSWRNEQTELQKETNSILIRLMELRSTNHPQKDGVSL